MASGPKLLTPRNRHPSIEPDSTQGPPGIKTRSVTDACLGSALVKDGWVDYRVTPRLLARRLGKVCNRHCDSRVPHDEPPIPIANPINFSSERRMLFVQAWPSTGRFLRKENPTPAELRYLGFDPSSSKLQVPRSPSQTEEDAFTKQLRRIGALEWENEDRCEEAYFGDSLDIGLRRFRQATYGWPSSGKGLWTWEYDAHPRRLEQEAEQRELLAALKGAQDMDEQCAILERLGLATFYEDPADYLRLADLYRVRCRGRVYGMREL